MARPTAEGEKKTCQTCKQEMVGRPVEHNGNLQLQWQWPDKPGVSHYTYDKSAGKVACRPRPADQPQAPPGQQTMTQQQPQAPTETPPAPTPQQKTAAVEQDLFLDRAFGQLRDRIRDETRLLCYVRRVADETMRELAGGAEPHPAAVGQAVGLILDKMERDRRQQRQTAATTANDPDWITAMIHAHEEAEARHRAQAASEQQGGGAAPQ